MNRLLTISTALAACLLAVSQSAAESPYFTDSYSPNVSGSLAAYFDDAAAPEEATAEEHKDAGAKSDCGCESSSDSCGSGCESNDGCCGCCGNGCGSSCGCCGDDWCTLCIDNCWPFTCCCDYGCPCTLKSHLSPCCNINYGGWLSMGYYSDNDPLSFDDNDLLSFWDNPDELNFDQQWFYVEKLAEGSCGCWDCGYRFDLVYGVDAQKTQAFGNSGFPDPQGWDNDWDHGKYGWALPQAYVQFNNGDWDLKIGHFFTPLGYEVIPKTGNFFYSHAYTMFNSEPFTHTGALATYSGNDNVTYYLGWTLGWDTGYDQFGNGSNFLGGATVQANDNVKVTYLTTAGDLGWRGDGYSHSIVADFTLSSKWNYVFQSDLLDTDTNTAALSDALSYGVNQYVFYTINDCWKWGNRIEWWKSNQVTGDMTSFYALATGVNYKASANVIIRPEVKYNWTPAEDTVSSAVGEQFENVIFGVDAIYTF